MERNRIKSLQKQNMKEIFCVRYCCCCWKDWEEMQMRKVFHQSSFRGSQNFAIFTAMHLCWSLFLIRLQRLAKCIQHRGFPVNIVKLFRTPILKKSANCCFWSFSCMKKSFIYPLQNVLHRLLHCFPYLSQQILVFIAWCIYQPVTCFLFTSTIFLKLENITLEKNLLTYCS